MPYKSKKHLPNKIKYNMPKEAQDLWKDVFNTAYKKLLERGAAKGDAKNIAKKEAWKSVERHYQKDGRGNWVKK